MTKVYLFLMALLCPILSTAQSVGINTNAPDASAALDISTNDKGLLPPRVSLSDVTNTASPVNSPAEGLIVYNTNTSVSGGDGTGYYYFDGAVWTKLTAVMDNDWIISGNDMYNGNSGNVGIGITSPNEKLDVNGNIRTNKGDIYLRESSDVNHGLGWYGTGKTFASVNVDGPVLYGWTGGALAAKSSGNRIALYWNNLGQVGIGTTAPSSLLEVSSGTAGDAVITLSADTDNSNEDDNPYIQFEQDAGAQIGFIGLEGEAGTRATGTLDNALLVGNQSPFALQLMTSNAVRMTVASGGNVGIGSTTPTGKLTVHGTNADTNPILHLQSGNSFSAFSNGAQISFGFNGTSHYQHFIHTRHNASNSSNAIDFYVSDGTQNNTVTSGSVHNLSMVSGNVGIGTTAPNTELQINDPNNAHVGLQWTTTATGTNSTDGFSILLNTASEVVLMNREATPMEFWTNYAQRMTIESGGNVGVGITNPESQLHVRGDGTQPVAIFEETATSPNIALVGASDGMRFEYNEGTDEIRVQTSNTDGTYGGATTMTIEAAGNVGIGTSVPVERLDVYPNSDVSAVIGRAHIGAMGHSDMAGFSHLDRNGTGSYALLQNSSGQTYLNSASGQNLNFRINNTNKMWINSDGRVHVGPEEPYYSDHIFAVRRDAKGANTRDNPVVSIQNWEDDNNDHCNGLEIIAGSTTPSVNHRMINFLKVNNPGTSTEIASVRQNGNNSVVYATGSDVRLKTNFAPSSYGLKELMKVEVRDYHFKTDIGVHENGFLAQQLHALYPFAVSKGGENIDDIWMVDYGRVTPLLVQAIQDQQTVIKQLEQRIADLEKGKQY